MPVNSESGNCFHFCWCQYYIEKHAVCLKNCRSQSFLSIRHVHGDLCKRLGIDSSTNPEGMAFC